MHKIKSREVTSFLLWAIVVYVSNISIFKHSKEH